MKKTLIASTVLALVALAGCQNTELTNGTYEPQEGEIVFKISNIAKETKSAAPTAQETGVSIPVKTEIGMNFTIDETVTNLDEVAFAPVTKGTPGYTENFNALYGGFDATVYRTGDEDAYEDGGRFEIANEEKRIYKRKYGNDLWDKGGLYFFLKATPRDKTVEGIENLTYYPTDVAADGDNPARSAGDISFHYVQSAATTAAAQQDILFTSRPVTSEAEYNKLISKDEGVNVLFHHALTGVKFRVGNNNSGTTKTIITKVEISGLYDIGDCDITPNPETNYTDVKDNYSSGTAVTWRNRNSTLVDFSQGYDNPDYTVYYKTDPETGNQVFDQDKNKNNPDGSVSTGDYQSGDYTFGASWYSAEADNNLNDANGTQTFWLIPQAFKNEDGSVRNVALRVTFIIKTPDTPEGTKVVHTITDFGSRLAAANVEWKAGELRTYTLNPLDVDVAIIDEVDGLVKTDLHVANTGNVDEYVRMMLVGNWYGWTSQASKDKGDEPSILVGYVTNGDNTHTDAENAEMVTPWYRKDDTFKQGFDSSFAGGEPASGSKWKYGTGSYFYYEEPIGAGEYLSGTAALFQKYELQEDWIPTIYIPSADSDIRSAAVGVHLVMEVVVQAISVLKPNGEEYADWKEAWSAATGETIDVK